MVRYASDISLMVDNLVSSTRPVSPSHFSNCCWPWRTLSSNAFTNWFAVLLTKSRPNMTRSWQPIKKGRKGNAIPTVAAVNQSGCGFVTARLLGRCFLFGGLAGVCLEHFLHLLTGFGEVVLPGLPVTGELLAE